MNVKKLAAVAFAAATSATLTAAVPEVSGVTMTQDSMRLVSITYTLADAPAVVTVDVQTNNANGGWASIGGEAVWNATGDVWRRVEAGSRTITWRPDHSWPDHKIADGGARAVVTAWALDNTPDYMAVDLTATGGADTQTYYPAADFVPGGASRQLHSCEPQRQLWRPRPVHCRIAVSMYGAEVAPRPSLTHETIPVIILPI